MQICEDGHDPIVHTQFNCPLCDAKATIEELKEEVEKLEKATEPKD